MTKSRKRRSRYDYSRPKSPALQARAEEMVRARMFGASLRNIAKWFGLSKTHVHRIVEGVLILFNRRPPRKLTYYKPRPQRSLHFSELRSKARHLRAQGYSYRQIAGQIGASDSFVHLHCNRVLIRELHGRAWLGRQGRPKQWMKQLLKGATRHD